MHLVTTKKEIQGCSYIHNTMHNKATTVLIRSVDTDIVLAIVTFHSLPVDELRTSFGVKKHCRPIPLHTIAQHIGDQKARLLTFGHAFIGCDTGSSFCSIGRITAFDIR